MKFTLKSIVLILAVFFTACNSKQKLAETKQESLLVFPQGDKITNNNFTGTAYLKQLIPADSLNTTQVGNVTFEPGARSNWHLHPAGQILLVIDGVGYYQEKDHTRITLRKGDVIKCPANVLHWHGASPDTSFVQVAITNTKNGPPVWQQAVTDEEYGK